MKKWNFDTEAIHFSEKFGEKGSMNVPIYQNSTFKQKHAGTWEEYTYTRTNNPTEDALSRSIAGLENAKHAVVFSSGLAAINAVMELLDAGDHVVSTADIYGGTNRLFDKFIKRRGIEFTYVNSSSFEAVRSAIKPNTKLVYVETPSNPLLEITDIRAVSSLLKEKNILFAVDNTMATPYQQRPLDLGADIVVHSISKYLSGHTNVVGGVVVLNDADLFLKLKFIHKSTGGIPGPFDCYLTMLGLKTLAVRMRQHQANAFKITEYLKAHEKITKVYYPGLPEHPQHELAKLQMNGFGGMISFEIASDEVGIMRFIESLELFSIAVSFGSVASIVSFPAKMSHKEMNRDERLARGFSDTLVRISVGIENDSDLIEDIGNALKTV